MDSMNMEHWYLYILLLWVMFI